MSPDGSSGARVRTPLGSSTCARARACPVCDSPGGEPAGTRIDGGCWLACAACEAVFLSPAPDEAALAAFYAGYYSSYRRLNVPTRASLEAAARAGQVDPLTAFGLQTLGGAPRAAADVGCGQGARLVVLRALGTSIVAGSELDEGGVREARDRYGVTVHLGSAGAIPSPEGGFDAVFLSEVIEHVLDPIGLVRSCARLLRPGGWLFLSTPNAGVRHRAHGTWAQLRLDLDHLTIFNDASIRRTLRAAGLVPVEVLTHGRPATSSERWQRGAEPGRAVVIVERLERVAKRVITQLRTPHAKLDPHEGYSLLCSARLPDAGAAAAR